MNRDTGLKEDLTQQAKEGLTVTMITCKGRKAMSLLEGIVTCRCILKHTPVMVTHTFVHHKQ